VQQHHRLALGVTIAIAVAGCSGGGSASPAMGDFVAQNTNFRGYRTWTSFTIDDGQAAGATHVAGKRTIYINQLPPAGATEFPIGTIIVKETAIDGKIFARAKRSPDWNPTGAVGWEWFELLTKAGATGIFWRGLGPPAGEVYGGDPNAGCNMCHKLAPNNDFVLTPALMLAGASDDAGVAGDGGDGEVDAGALDATNETGADAGLETGPE
jgi:hypothetical protein